MGLMTEIVDNGKGVLQTGIGIVLGREIIDSANAILEAGKTGIPLRYSIVDLSNIEQLFVTANEIKAIASINVESSRFIKHMTVAVIATSDLVYGVARMWEVYVRSAGWNTHVFRDAVEAKKWLESHIFIT